MKDFCDLTCYADWGFRVNTYSDYNCVYRFIGTMKKS